MNPSTEEHREEVRRLLARAGLPASETEIDKLAAGMPLHEDQVKQLWAVEAARYGEPALIFQAAPSLDAWS